MSRGRLDWTHVAQRTKASVPSPATSATCYNLEGSQQSAAGSLGRYTDRAVHLPDTTTSMLREALFRSDIEKMLDLTRDMATSQISHQFSFCLHHGFLSSAFHAKRRSSWLVLFFISFLALVFFFFCFHLVTCAKSHEGTKMDIRWELPLCCF